MIENYIQYAEGYQKDNIDETDIEKAIADIQLMEKNMVRFGFQLLQMKRM